MLDYAFVEVLETLTRDELKDLRRFIISPYFNRSQKAVKLFDIITKYHPNYDSPKLTKESIHKKITPELEYNELTMRSLLHDFQQLVSKFVRQQHIERKEAESKLFIIEELAIRGSERMHALTVRDTEKILNNYKQVDSDLCLSKFKLETEKFYFGMINDKIQKKNFVDTEAGKLINGITYFISYFMLEAIKHNETLLNYSRIYNVKHNIKFISQFLDLFDFERLEIFMEKHSLAESYIVKAYLNFLKAFLYFDNEEYFYKLKSSVFEHLNKYSTNDKFILFAKLSDYCILKRSSVKYGNNKYEYELFEIYKTFISNRFYETEANKYIPVDLYRNILIQSARLKELKFMDEFISEYSSQLHPKRKEDIINYSYAMLEFERGNYNESLAWLSRIKTEEFSYHLDIRLLYIQIYYELHEYDTVLAASKAFIKFLNENKMVSESKKSGFESFCKYINRLVNFQNTTTKTDLSSLTVQVMKNKTISSKNWLLEKIEKLDKKALKKYLSAV